MIIQPARCGNCAFAQTVKEDLNLVECHGTPPTPVVMGMTPQGPAIGILWPRIPRMATPCALHKKQEAPAAANAPPIEGTATVIG